MKIMQNSNLWLTLGVKTLRKRQSSRPSNNLVNSFLWAQGEPSVVAWRVPVHDSGASGAYTQQSMVYGSSTISQCFRWEPSAVERSAIIWNEAHIVEIYDA
jgi:hypothetical protein